MSWRSRAGMAGLAGLAVADVVLVVLAFGAVTPPHLGSTTATSERSPAPLTSPVVSPTTRSAPSTTPTVTDRPAALGPPGPVLPMAAASAGLVLRADPGTCADGGGALWLTEDGGATWRRLPSPAEEIRRVALESATSMWVVGAKSATTAGDCKAAFWRSADAGHTWDQAASTRGAWYVPADTKGGLHAPDTIVRDVCGQDTPLVVVPVGFDSATVACPDGAMRWTDDGGQLWRSRPAVPGLRALGLWSPTAAVAVAITSDCAGLAVSTTADGGRTWSEQACLGTPDLGPTATRCWSSARAQPRRCG